MTLIVLVVMTFLLIFFSNKCFWPRLYRLSQFTRVVLRLPCPTVSNFRKKFCGEYFFLVFSVTLLPNTIFWVESNQLVVGSCPE